MTALWTVRPRNAPIEIAPAGLDFFRLDFTALAVDSTFTYPELTAMPLNAEGGRAPSFGTFSPGFGTRTSIADDGDRFLRITTPSGAYGVQDCGASFIVDLDDWGDTEPASSVVNEGIYAAGADEVWGEIVCRSNANHSWNSVSAPSDTGWKFPMGFLLGAPKDTRWNALGSPGGDITQEQGRNTGGKAGTGDWWSGGSTRPMMRWEQPAVDNGFPIEAGPAITLYGYHANQTAGPGTPTELDRFGDYLFFCADENGILRTGRPSATENVRNPRATGGLAENGDYINYPDGRWVRFGQRCKLNTPGVDDGEVEYFIDGVSIGVVSNIEFRGAEATWGAQAYYFNYFSGGSTAGYATTAQSILDVQSIRCADFDFVTA